MVKTMTVKITNAERMKNYENREEPAVQAVPEIPSYEAAVARFQQACEAVKEKKRAVYDAFRKAEKLFKDGSYERVRLEVGDPFSVAMVDDAVMTTGDPIDAKKYVSYARSVVRSVFLDDTFSAAVVRVIQEVSTDARSKESALINDVLAAEKDLAESMLKLQKKVSQAKAALAEHRETIKHDIIDPAMEADRAFVADMPCIFAESAVNRNPAIRMGPDVAVSAQLQSLLKETLI